MNGWSFVVENVVMINFFVVVFVQKKKHNNGCVCVCKNGCSYDDDDGCENSNNGEKKL